jgi:hypothetical protein
VECAILLPIFQAIERQISILTELSLSKIVPGRGMVIAPASARTQSIIGLDRKILYNPS